MVERISKFFGGLVQRFAVWVYTPDPEQQQQQRAKDLAAIATLGKNMPIGERHKEMETAAQ